MPHASFDAEFAELRQRYRPKLERQIELLAALLDEARAETPAGARVEAGRQLAHRLKGTAGTYGFGAASGALERIEDQLAGLQGDARVDGASVWREIAAALAAASAAAARP